MVLSQFPIHAGQTWSQKVFEADNIWAKVEAALNNAGVELPKTPRRPDVRMILNNNTGKTIQFLNPGNHSGEKQEFIPGVDTGDGTAAMIMLAGDTLDEQFANAQKLIEQYGLAETGLTAEFARNMGHAVADGLMVEAYGPAPFEGQASRLEPLHWAGSDIEPVIGQNAAYGARAPEMETVMRSEIAIFVKGSNTTPEKMEMEGICIAVSKHWQTGDISTRPIVPSVAQDFYGEHYTSMPIVELDTEGNVSSIDLNNGQPKIFLNDPSKNSPYAEGDRPDMYGDALDCQ